MSSGELFCDHLSRICLVSPKHLLSVGFHHCGPCRDGLHLDGYGDYVKVIDPSPYAHDSTFTVSMWLTKPRGSGGCSGGIYEYLFSHSGANFPRAIDGSDTPTVALYIGCDCGCARDCSVPPNHPREQACHGWSSATGTIIRHNLVDDLGHTAIFDFPLRDSGDFDSVTAVWIHTVMVVNRLSVVTFDDGVQVPSNVYGFYAPQGDPVTPGRPNIAYPHPNALSTPLTTFTLNTELVLGGRHDLNTDRHFQVSHRRPLTTMTSSDDSDSLVVFEGEDGIRPGI